VDDAYGPLRAGAIERAKEWEPSWYGATVSPQLNRPMATEGRTQSDFWKAFLSRTSLPRLTARGGMTPFPRDRRTL
jgi:hypothetical protein